MESNAKDSSTANQSLVFQSPTFGKDVSFVVDEAVGSASISPSGRDVVLGSQEGLHVIDLDNPYSRPRHLSHRTPWEVADVQWSPFAAKDYWVCSTSNQKALVWNLDKSSVHDPIEHVLHAHTRAITDINFSAHHPEILATCAVDGHIHCWDLRSTSKPVTTFCDWIAGATQVKYNRQDPHVLASSHDRHLHIWDDRMGNRPLKSIEAHETKIYGIDWNRTKANYIITCSLDKTVKFWDYTKDENNPNRIIKTPFPVWRARHTPFGSGVLVMPQRGNHELHLYDTIPNQEITEDGFTKPVHSFVGHENQVKEFLWRTRNTIEDSIDKRDFQLVTWGTDRNLMLHRVEDKHLELVGHKRNTTTDDEYNLTRKGAIYKTFNNERSSPAVTYRSMAPLAQGLSSMFREALSGKSSRGIGSVLNKVVQSTESDRAGMNIKSVGKKREDPIAWMKGVKIVKNEDDLAIATIRQRVGSMSITPWEKPESLGDEIIYVGEKYKNVTFDFIDISARSATISLNGPWGTERKLVYVKLSISFPQRYPEISPDFKIEKTSSIPESIFDSLGRALREIADSCVLGRRGCLEPIFVFLLGERDRDETLAWIENDQNALVASSITRESDSSSDDEDGLVGKLNRAGVMDMETSATDIVDLENSNVNVPLAKACGALWADNGRLVCFFPRREELPSVIAGLAIGKGDKSQRSHGMFGGYGRLYPKSTKQQRRTSSSNESAPDLSGSLSTSSDSSTSDENLDTSWNFFQNTIGFRGVSLRQLQVGSIDHSHHSSAAIGTKLTNGSQNVVLHRLEDLLPSRKSLAEEYMIFGDGPKVCTHNAAVALKHGLNELGAVWKLCALVLNADVPLNLLHDMENQDILVLARRAIVQIKSRDSGLDLSFDGPESVVNPKFNGRVKWGQHPLAGTWLVPSLFDHFEKIADVQMLAMLSCVFSEPAADHTVSIARKSNMQGQMPMPLEAPAFSFDYFPSADVALAHLQSDTPGLVTSRTSPNRRDAEFAPPTDPYILWPEETTENDYPQSYPKLVSPPNGTGLVRTASSLGQSLKESPSTQEQNTMRRSNSSIGTSFAASFSSRFPFMTSASSSPPNFSEMMQRRSSMSSEYPGSLASNSLTGSVFSEESHGNGPQGGRSNSLSRYDDGIRSNSSWDRRSAQARYDEDLLTSGRWSRLSERSGEAGQPSAQSLASFGFSAVDAQSSFTEEAVIDSEPEPTATILLKNQHLFDDEGYASVPLLDPRFAHKLKAYRDAYAHLLFVWGLNDKRCEILKFNGLTPYFLDTDSRPPQTAASQPNQQGEFTSNRSSWQGFKLISNLSRRLQCSICSETVNGLHKACLKCGHVSHINCLTLWLDGQPPGEENECEAGCGCMCTIGPTAPMSPSHTYFDAGGEYMMSPLGLGARVHEWGQLLGADQEWARAGGRTQSRITPSALPAEDITENFEL